MTLVALVHVSIKLQSHFYHEKMNTIKDFHLLIKKQQKLNFSQNSAASLRRPEGQTIASNVPRVHAVSWPF